MLRLFRLWSVLPSILLLLTAFSVGAITPLGPADALFAHDRELGARDRPVAEALDALLAEAVYVPSRASGGFARTRAEAKSALLKGPLAEVATIAWQPVKVGISADGGQGFSAGYLTLRAADGSSRPGKYLAYWQRGKDGWRVLAYRITPAPAATPSLQRWPNLVGQSALDAAKVAQESLQQSLRAAEQAFSDRAQVIGLGPAFAEFGRPDSLNLGGAASAEMVKGADAIAKLVGDGEPASGSSVYWAADVGAEVAGSGDLGVTFGYIRIHPRQNEPADKLPPPIPFFTVWARAGADQPWRYVAE